MRILAILPEGDPAAPFSSTSVYRPRRPRLARSALPNLDAMTSSPDRHPRLHRPSAGSGGQPRPPPDSEVRFGNASYICRRLHYLIPLLGGSIAPRRAPEHPFVLLMRRCMMHTMSGSLHPASRTAVGGYLGTATGAP